MSTQKKMITALLPPSVLEDPLTASSELVRAVLVRSNYIPGVRHRLGWCGINEVVSSQDRPGTLTTRLNVRPGVFGLFALDTLPGQGARFNLSYFPMPHEDILEDFSIEAGIEALTPDFVDRVRVFNHHPRLCDLFHIGSIHARVQEAGVFLALTARDTLGWTSEKGIEIQGPDGPVQAVSPGGMDQNLGARPIVMDFFDSLAASFSYTLSSGPGIVYAQERNGCCPFPQYLESHEHRLTLGYFTDKTALQGFDWGDSPVKICWVAPGPLPSLYKDKLWWKNQISGAGNSLDKKAMGIKDKPRFILLTGFLGSGKTSFLDKFIQAQTANNCFVAVVQNEIGEKDLDTRLLDETYAVTQMDEGCVCCSLAGNLRTALSDIMDRFQPDFIVLETTGLANPANILREVDDLADLLTLGSITTLIDAGSGHLNLDRFEVARDQVRLADVILINKCDLLEGEPPDSLIQKITQLNPIAEVHQTCQGAIHPGLLYGVNFQDRPRRPLFRAIGAGATHVTDRIETRLFEFDSPLDKGELATAIKGGGQSILRVKGIVEFIDEKGPMVFQFAPGTWEISPLQGHDMGDRFLVVIGQDLDKNFILSSAIAPPKGS